MNTKTFFTLFLSVLFLSSCASLPKGTSRFDESNSPYVKEKPETAITVKEEVPAPKPALKSEPVMVREEKVTTVDQLGTETIYRYYVIIGSFQVVDNARSFRTQLIDEQFTPVILQSEIGFFRVSVAAFNDEMDARSRIAQIRDNYDKYSDVWLLIRKN